MAAPSGQDFILNWWLIASNMQAAPVFKFCALVYTVHSILQCHDVLLSLTRVTLLPQQTELRKSIHLHYSIQWAVCTQPDMNLCSNCTGCHPMQDRGMINIEHHTQLSLFERNLSTFWITLCKCTQYVLFLAQCLIYKWKQLFKFKAAREKQGFDEMW